MVKERHLYDFSSFKCIDSYLFQSIICLNKFYKYLKIMCNLLLLSELIQKCQLRQVSCWLFKYSISLLILHILTIIERKGSKSLKILHFSISLCSSIDCCLMYFEFCYWVYKHLVILCLLVN